MEVPSRPFTYRDLYNYLHHQVEPDSPIWKQPVQILLHQADGDKPIPLCEAIAIGSVQEMTHNPEDFDDCIQATRSSVDNKHHPEQLVLLADKNPFSEDGAFAYDLDTGEPYYLPGMEPEDGKKADWGKAPQEGPL